MIIKTIGIVGSGQMGRGIAQSMAMVGYKVILSDISKEVLKTNVEKIVTSLTRQVKDGRISLNECEEALDNLKSATKLETVAGADLIIEAVTEDEAVKTLIFESLTPHLKEDTILTSNTSSISITRLASRTDRPEKFMGFHFMNPVPLMQLVELIRGIATNQDTYDSFIIGISTRFTISRGFPWIYCKSSTDANDK